MSKNSEVSKWLSQCGLNATDFKITGRGGLYLTPNGIEKALRHHRKKLNQKGEYMSIVNSTGNITLCGENVSYITYHLDGDAPEVFNEEDMIFGCDCMSVAVSTDKSAVEQLVSKISEKDLEILKDEFNINCISIYEINGVFIIPVEYENLTKDLVDVISNQFIVFGAISDDVSIIDCIIGYQYMKVNGMSEEDLEDFDIDEAKDVENYSKDELDELEFSMDFLQRIYDCTENTNMKSEIPKILEKLEFLI